ncbi:MAG: peptidase [Ignavibacteria bacterium]|nr:peptidase [Ignavibacteria bacterium]
MFLIRSFMLKLFLIAMIIYLIPIEQYSQSTENKLQKKYSEIAKKIYEAAMSDTTAFERLAYMCDTYGPRISGSQNLENALDWAEKEMNTDGFDKVGTDETLVPRWVRGAESCFLLEPRKTEMRVLGLGGTIATPKEGITAPVLVVKNYDELSKRSAEAKGKIILYTEPFKSYGQSVQYRSTGSIEAARYGGVAAIIRPPSPMSMGNPHTGYMAYNDSFPKVPGACISAEDCDMLERMQKRGQKPVIKLMIDDTTLPDSKSRNLWAEIQGSSLKDEFVAFGGHCDSWDVGTGAQDDGGACIAVWQALKIIKELGLKPRRTMRCVWWVNEENGLRGGKAYAEQHKNEKHLFAFEFDSGVFPPSELTFKGPDSIFETIKMMKPLLAPIDSMDVVKGGWGIDIGPLVNNGANLLSLGTRDNGKYFWYHHSYTDTPDKINLNDFRKCIAAIAISIYICADAEF